jgi:general L-amino acid transport system permease protein
LIRGVPLVTVLFMGALLLPLFLPGGESIDALVRAIVAVTLFSAAYLAENVRGGLQSIPKGQIEAARALGLNVFQTTLLITLPQALRAVVPVLVGQFIALFKDTSLVVIIGLVDLLGAAQNIVGQPQWLGTPGGVWRETFLVIAAIYWVFSFTMSRISKRIEDQIARSRH